MSLSTPPLQERSREKILFLEVKSVVIFFSKFKKRNLHLKGVKFQRWVIIDFARIENKFNAVYSDYLLFVLSKTVIYHTPLNLSSVTRMWDFHYLDNTNSGGDYSRDLVLHELPGHMSLNDLKSKVLTLKFGLLKAWAIE